MREDGKTIALLYHATGVGKTITAATDAKAVGGRTLFLVNALKLAAQAKETFAKVWPEATLGEYTGSQKDMTQTVIFATVQSISKDLEKFSPTDFDYLIVDECHHAAANTYQKIFTYFHPKFILGLTATPERSDGEDMLELFQNVAHKMDLKTAAAPKKPLPDAVPDTENLPAPEPKTPQEVEAERQQMLARLRTELREQVCAIHADVTLPPDRERGSEAVEQQLHVLLYQTDVPEAELNAALSDLRTQRRREKAQYQGAPFADVFQVELILSEEDSDRACIVDVGDTGMSYVIPWSSIPQELQQPLRRYVAQADGKLCGYCRENLCNTENGRMVVELYLGKQEHHVSRILY